MQEKVEREIFMLLEKRFKGGGLKCLNEYYSELTKELDGLARFAPDSLRRHYILTDKVLDTRKCLFIRIPGGTVGNIEYDENNIITDIRIDTNYIVRTYPDDVNEHMKKYIGQHIEFECE